VTTKTVATGHDKDGNPVQVNVGKDGQTQQVADVQKVEQKTDVNVNVAEIKVTHAGSIQTPLNGKDRETIKALGESIVIAKGDGDRLAAELNKKLGAPKTDTA
jgi:predicted nucleotidyltransferase